MWVRICRVIAVFALLAAPVFTLCIDPGHPSEVHDGRTLQNGLREVSLCWNVSQELEKMARSRGIRVVITKSKESEYITNRRRAEIANEAKADLMLRIHADANNGSGFTVYHPNKRGMVSGVSGPDETVIHESRWAAQLFYPAFRNALMGELKGNGVRGDEATKIGGKQGALTGSIFSKVPTLLVEMVFLSNPKDADWIRKRENQRKMANALLRGVLAVRDAKR